MPLNLREDVSVELRQMLEDNQAIVEATIQPYVEIKLHPQPQLSLWQSKVGGFPYLPENFEYPKGEKGQELQLLAQINFAETPHLPKFPQAGILQFYIDSNDDLYGANFDDLSDHKNFRVLYFSEIEADESKLITDFSFLPEFEYSPVSGSAALKFEKKFAAISYGDYQFDSCLGNLFTQVDDSLRWEYYDKISEGIGHKIGGYPGFTQTDPRADYESCRAYDCLLFQLDSEFGGNGSTSLVDVLWGDSGIANFFIKSEALEKLDFSDILFNWDCC